MNGYYPVGYYKASSQCGIINDISDMAMGKPTMRKNVMIMAYTALDAPITIQSGFNFKDIPSTYIIADGKNGVELRTPRATLDSKK